jgi:hypothetical protein
MAASPTAELAVAEIVVPVVGSVEPTEVGACVFHPVTLNTLIWQRPGVPPPARDTTMSAVVPDGTRRYAIAQFVLEALLTAIVAAVPPIDMALMKYEPDASWLMAAVTTTSLSADAVPIAVPAKV